MSRCFLVLCLAVMLSVPAAASDDRSLDFGGQVRTYHLYRPSNLGRAAKVPLVVVLHGGLGSGAQAERAYGWDGEADARGFVVVYPDGVGRTWNAGGACCGAAHRDGVDDVGFLDTLIKTTVRDENIDSQRIYVTGMSNGAAMAYRYASEGKVRLAAIGPVAGSYAYAGATARPVSVLAVHGLADKNVPFAGGPGRVASGVVWQPVQSSLDVFRSRCGAPTETRDGVVVTTIARCGEGREVELVTVADAGHQWPGSQRRPGLLARLLPLDQPSQAVAATPLLWAFFVRHVADITAD